ncbi:recombinase family protein [Ureibacillus thermosphaericus]|uniref:recombinase family protein n=1 Tax=Ureibacillus thermosphaericus TaxID=51173 RepID=UPI000BBCB574|nr:recombinase family protein [Ureibacillus thermosphaericus]
MGLNFGYMRVSTTGQNLDRQEEALLKFVSKDENGKPYLYSDKASGKDMDRTGFQEMYRAMRSGDTLYIKSIDRLGRNKHQIKEYLMKFRKKGIQVKIIDIPTTMQEFPKGQEWITEMINNIIIEVVTSMAEQERINILQRQREGIEIARKKGKHLGRPIMPLPKNWTEQYKLWKQGKIRTVDFMKAVNMKKSTFYKKLKEYEIHSDLKERH